MKPLALQLYTVRERAEMDLIGTIREVADIGYKGIEFAGLFGHDPAEVARVMSDLGIITCSSHTGLPTKKNVQQMAEAELALGSPALVTGFGPDDLKDTEMCRRAAERLQLAAELLAPYGLSLGYHNHWWEFHKVEDGRYAYDVILSEAPDVFSELDIYWCAFGGADVIQTLKTHGDRIRLLHVKDGTLEQGVPQKAVGAGVLDIPEMLAAADPEVVQWLIAENDDAAIDLMETAKLSYTYLTSKGLAEGRK